jgi:protein O-GlcNAc transferase
MAGFLLYPTTFQETGCITVLRAMFCGAIPITSRLRPSVLQTLTQGYDLGPLLPLTLSDSQDPAWLGRWLAEHWTPAVIRAHRTSRDELDRRRRDMKQAIRRTYSWTETANTFINIVSNS